MEKELFTCGWCHEDFDDLMYWQNDDDIGWCSDFCVQSSEDAGIQRWESQQEYYIESHDESDQQ